MLRPLLLRFAALVTLAVGTLPQLALAERPTASQLLPDSTVAYLRIDKASELGERFQKTATGRMLNDPKIKPLVAQLYGSLVDAYKQVEDRIGVPLDRLLTLPQGEVCFAVVPPAEGNPEIVLWFDAGNRFLDAMQVIERLDDAIVGRGGTKSTDRVGDVEMTTLKLPFGNLRTVARAEKDNIVCLSTNPALLKQLLNVWSGKEKVRSLAEANHFTAIMSRCQGDQQNPPQVSWFLNPIELIRRAGRGDFSAQAGLAMMTALGVDGIQAVGGTLTFATDQFDMVAETQLLLETPRKGVVKMIAVDSGEVTPEPWVPHDATAYMTMNWDVRQTYNELVRLVNVIQGEGAWKNNVVDRILERTDLELEKDVIDALSGRFTLITWMERPPRWNSQCTLVGLRLKDAAATRQALGKLIAKFPNRFQKDIFGGVEFYRLTFGNRERQMDEQLLRQPTPCLAIVGDYLLAGDSVKLLNEAISCKDNASESLANELDYKLIATNIKRRLGDKKAGMVAFSRPEDALRNMYEMLNSPAIRNRITSQAANNGFFRAINDALVKNPLPPFSVLAQYLAPTGALLINDETGIHYSSFALKRE
jgi:hypothetical protein